MSSKRAVVEEFNSLASWFETASFVSALTMPSKLGLGIHTSCSASRSAGLDSFASSCTQTKAGIYYVTGEQMGGRCEE